MINKLFSLLITYSVSITSNAEDNELTKQTNISENLDNTPSTQIEDSVTSGFFNFSFDLEIVIMFFVILLLIILAIIIYSRFSTVIKMIDDSMNFSNQQSSQLNNLTEQLDELKTQQNYITSEMAELQSSLKSASKDDFNLVQFPRDLDNKLNDFTELITKYSKSVFQIIKNDQKLMLEEIKDSIIVFKKMATEKSDELNNYKDGYDFLKFKRVFLEILELDMRIKSYQHKFSLSEGNEVCEYFEALSKSLNILLSNNNIEEFTIPVMTDVLENSECEPIDDIEITTDEDRVNKVAEVISSGYKVFLSDNESKIIKKARVKVYGIQ